MDYLYNSLIYYAVFNITYYASSFITYLYDCNIDSECNSDNKNQLTCKDELTNTYNKIKSTVLLNTFVFSVPAILFAGYYDTYIMTGPFIISKCLLDIIFALICIDPFFYGTHKLLHHKVFYERFHKKHHKISKPVGMAALYTTVTEFYVGNVIPIFLPLYIVGAHHLVVKLWLIFIIVNTIFISHSGYKKFGDFHDKHHQYFTKNYGTDIFVDKLLGTYV